MKNLNRSLRRATARGFTLVEMMIAMLLGLIVTGGVIGVVLVMMQTSRANSALCEVQAGTRIAFEMLAHDLRNARLTGCNSNGRVANVLKQQDTAWWADWNNAFIGHAGSQTDPAVPDDRVPGTDSIMVLGAADTAMSVSGHDAAAGTFTVHGATGTLRSGDVVIACDPHQAAIFQTTTITPNTSLTYDADHNCTAALGYPGGCTGTPYTFDTNAQIAPLSAADWYVGTSDDGTKSLFRMTLGNVAGTPTPAPQEMVRGVTGMSLRYLQTGQLLAADDPAIDWSKVTAVQVTLNLQSTSQPRAGVDGQPISRPYTTTIALYNRLN